jgi:hypothetical protein
MNTSENDRVLISDYSSTSGMSGTPVYNLNGSIPYLLGINFGKGYNMN